MAYFPEQSASPDAGPEDGPPPPRLTIRQRAAAFWLNVLFWSVGRMPRVARATIGFWIWMAWIFSPSLRHHTSLNARHLLGVRVNTPQVRRLARSILRSFYLFIHDVGVHQRLSPAQLRDQVAAVSGEAHYENARRPGRGAILATAHIGSFEVAAAALAGREKALHVVFRRDRFGLFDRVRSNLHAKLGIHEVAVDEGVGAWLRIGEALRRDEVVLMQADRVMPGQRGIPVSFLDGWIQMPIGPAKLAMLTGAPIVPVFAIRLDDGRVSIHIHRPICTDSPDQTIESITRGLSSVIEGVVRAHPSQWMALHDAWAEDGTDERRGGDRE